MMRTRFLISAAVALIGLGAVRSPLGAQAATVCKDGTTSATSGRGACSGHGGVDAAATDAAKKAAKKAAKTEAKTERKASKKAETKAEQVTCTDGTTSTAGRGACSGHGGVKRAAATTAAPSLPAPVPSTSPARTKSQAKSKAPSATTEPSSKRGEDNDPKDAIAQCKDGMYSHAANRRGACSRHGGVSKWLKEP